MAIDSQHPAHEALTPIWEMLTDSYTGEPAVKGKTTEYLPATSGMVADGYPTLGSIGALDYKAYILRAVYPDLYREAIKANVGTMHSKEPVIQLPTSMESLRENATADGESLMALMRRVNTAQLDHGRLGLMGDIAVEGSTATPYLSTYSATCVRNWSQTRVINGKPRTTLVVLDETGPVMLPDLSWETQTKYRVIALVDSAMRYDPVNGTIYATVEVTEDGVELDAVEFIRPELYGKSLEALPFQFVNSSDIVAAPNMPPLLGLALLAMTIYRGESDYRQSLFQQGQDTLVEIGHPTSQGSADEPARRTGTGASILVPMGGDAKYIGVSGTGLPEQRTALENDYKRASQRGGQLLDATGGAAEAAEALRIRLAASTTTLPQVALAGAAAIEDVLRTMAPLFGANPEEVSIEPNLDFTSDVLDGLTLVNLMTAKTLGAPFSLRSIHAWGQDNGLTKMSYDDEMVEIATEPTDMDVPFDNASV